MRRTRLVLWLLMAAIACAQPVQVGGLSQALMPPTAALHAPLYLEVWLRAHGSVVGPLLPGMRLREGDRLGVSARTSCSANVLLLYCDRDHVLSVFPERGALAFEPDRRVQLPAAGMDLPVGADAGSERLYVLASRAPLAQADPALAAALGAQAPPACDAGFEALLRGGAEQPRRLAAVRGIDVSDAYHGVARAFAAEDGVVVLSFEIEHAL